MKNSLYILGSIEAILGAVILWLTSLANEIMPALGRIAFQAAAAGSYSSSDYALDVTFPYLIGGILILAGIGQILLSILKKK